MFLQNFTNPGFSSEWLAEVEQYFFQEPLETNFCNKNKIFEVVAYLEGKILDISKFLLVAVTKIKTNVNESSSRNRTEDDRALNHNLFKSRPRDFNIANSWPSSNWMIGVLHKQTAFMSPKFLLLPRLFHLQRKFSNKHAETAILQPTCIVTMKNYYLVY